MTLVDWSLMDNKTVRGALVIILLSAALLRLYGIDFKSLEADEIFTVGIAHPENNLLEVLSIPLHNTPVAKPAFYFLVTHLFLRLGNHDFLLRFPSLAFGVLGVAATYAVGAALFGRKGGLVAAFLLCLSPLHIRYSQWSRFYTMLMTFSMLSLYFLYRGMHEGNRKRWVAFMGTTVLNLYAHLFAFFVLLSESIFFILAWLYGLGLSRKAQRGAQNRGHNQKLQPWIFTHRRCVLTLIASLAIVGIAYLPMAPHLLASLGGPKVLAEEAETPGLEPGLSFCRGLLAEWSGGSGLAILIFLALFVLGILASLRNRRMEIVLAAVWTSVPLAVLLAVPIQHRFYPRYLVFLLPIYLIVIAKGLTACNSGLAGILERVCGEKRRYSWIGLALGLAVLAGVSLSPLPEYYEERISDWKAAGTFLADMVSPGEVIVVRRPENQIALSHYDERLEHVVFGVARPRDALPSDLRYEKGVWFVGKEGRKNEMSRLEEELTVLSGGPVFRMVFQGHGDHTGPGAGESMFWDVWVLYARPGLDRTQLIGLYEQALDIVPAYATAFVHRALQDLSPEENASEGRVGGADAVVRLERMAPELRHSLASTHERKPLHDQSITGSQRNEELSGAPK